MKQPSPLLIERVGQFKPDLLRQATVPDGILTASEAASVVRCSLENFVELAGLARVGLCIRKPVRTTVLSCSIADLETAGLLPVHAPGSRPHRSRAAHALIWPDVDFLEFDASAWADRQFRTTGLLRTFIAAYLLHASSSAERLLPALPQSRLRQEPAYPPPVFTVHDMAPPNQKHVLLSTEELRRNCCTVEATIEDLFIMRGQLQALIQAMLKAAESQQSAAAPVTSPPLPPVDSANDLLQLRKVAEDAWSKASPDGIFKRG